MSDVVLVDHRTLYQGYPLPNGDNFFKVDVNRLINFMNQIDLDIHYLYDSVGDFSASYKELMVNIWKSSYLYLPNTSVETSSDLRHEYNGMTVMVNTTSSDVVLTLPRDMHELQLRDYFMVKNASGSHRVILNTKRSPIESTIIEPLQTYFCVVNSDNDLEVYQTNYVLENIYKFLISETLLDARDFIEVPWFKDNHLYLTTSNYTGPRPYIYVDSDKNLHFSVSSESGVRGNANIYAKSAYLTNDLEAKDCNFQNVEANTIHANYFSADSVGTHTFTASGADIAEYYSADAPYPVGTPLQFGGIEEVTVASDRVDGIVSYVPSLIMNKDIFCKNPALVAFLGRVKAICRGPLSKFDYLTVDPNAPGVLIKSETQTRVISLGSLSEGKKALVEVVIR